MLEYSDNDFIFNFIFNDGHINSFIIAPRIVGNPASLYVSNKNCNIL